MKKKIGVMKMDSVGRFNNFGIELLTQSNYKIWRSCMESYFIGEDLWEVVRGQDMEAPQNILKNADSLMK